MTLEQTERLITVLRTNGATHFKNLEVEIRLSAVPTLSQPSDLLVTPQDPRNAAAVVVPPSAAAVPPVEMVIPHHVNEVKKLLKLSDNDLVERMFPEDVPGKDE